MNMRRRRGFGQMEVVISTILVGVLMVSSFSAVAASRRSQTFESNKIRGVTIAEALLAEICQLPLQDTVNGGFGIGSDEKGANRSKFDDVDDYHNLIDSPPKSKNGAVCVGYNDLSRRVTVDMVTPSNWSVKTSTYAGVYRITVTVWRGSLEVCRIVGYRADGSSGSSSVVSANSNL